MTSRRDSPQGRGVAAQAFAPPSTLPEPPAGFMGSFPEFVCYQELINQRYVPDVDFSFQSSQLGGRASLGGLVIDFLFQRPATLAIEINGRYYHYDRPSSEQAGQDVYKRGQMASLGYVLIFLDDFDLLRDPSYYVKEALAFQDHSELRI